MCVHVPIAFVLCHLSLRDAIRSDGNYCWRCKLCHQIWQSCVNAMVEMCQASVSQSQSTRSEQSSRLGCRRPQKVRLHNLTHKDIESSTWPSQRLAPSVKKKKKWKHSFYKVNSSKEKCGCYCDVARQPAATPGSYCKTTIFFTLHAFCGD